MYTNKSRYLNYVLSSSHPGVESQGVKDRGKNAVPQGPRQLASHALVLMRGDSVL